MHNISNNFRHWYDEENAELDRKIEEKRYKDELDKKRDLLKHKKIKPSTSKIFVWFMMGFIFMGILWVMWIMQKYPEYAISSGLYALIGLFSTLAVTVLGYFFKSAKDHSNGIFDTMDFNEQQSYKKNNVKVSDDEPDVGSKE
jgi:hypothetical protein